MRKTSWYSAMIRYPCGDTELSLIRKVENCKRFDELSKKRRDELMSTVELLDEVLLEPYISDTNIRLLVRRINVHENDDGTLDVMLEFNGDIKDTSTSCFEI